MLVLPGAVLPCSVHKNHTLSLMFSIVTEMDDSINYCTHRVCTLALFRFRKLRLCSFAVGGPALCSLFVNAAVAEIPDRLSFPLRKWMHLRNVAAKLYHFIFSGSDAQSFCAKHTETTRIKEPFKKPKYYTDNISSCVNWIQKKGHCSSGNTLNFLLRFCLDSIWMQSL